MKYLKKLLFCIFSELQQTYDGETITDSSATAE